MRASRGWPPADRSVAGRLGWSEPAVQNAWPAFRPHPEKTAAAAAQAAQATTRRYATQSRMADPLLPKYLPVEVDVKNHRSERRVRIAWEDGHAATYPYDYLRGHCPCASCQGHFQAAKFIPSRGAQLVEVSLVGSYAFAMSWADGHDTGIYTFRRLRDLCPCPTCRPDGVPELATIGVDPEK